MSHLLDMFKIDAYKNQNAAEEPRKKLSITEHRHGKLGEGYSTKKNCNRNNNEWNHPHFDSVTGQWHSPGVAMNCHSTHSSSLKRHHQNHSCWTSTNCARKPPKEIV